MKPFGTCSLSILMHNGLESVSKIVIVHDTFVELSFFFLMSVELPFNMFDVLGYVTKVLELSDLGGVVGKGEVEFVDRLVV